jgi:2-phospho-L-lactate/phosphoenolpyruvate guanylyltransferase
VTAEVLVPIKDFRRAKLRLAPCLDATDRARLARAMAARVLSAAAPLPTVVVCDDAAVATFARQHGAALAWTPGLGLNGAVAEAVRRCARRGVDRVVVSHADLPLAVDLADVADFDGVTLVPDRHGQGTNVAAVPAGAGFGWTYGPGSFSRHRAEALRLGLTLRVMNPPELTWDVDLPDDLAVPAGAELHGELADLLVRRPGC